MLGLVIETVENYLLPIGPTVGALRSHGIAGSGKFPGPAPFWLTFQRHGTGPAARVAAGRSAVADMAASNRPNAAGSSAPAGRSTAVNHPLDRERALAVWSGGAVVGEIMAGSFASGCYRDAPAAPW
jgi:hypothetical protein